MECGIQLGHGMRGYTERLIHEWGSAKVMLGPRNFDSRGKSAFDKLVAYSQRIGRNGASVYIDPQLFSCKLPQKNLSAFPHCRACQQNLYSHFHEVVYELVQLNASAKTCALVLPSNTEDSLDGEWLSLQQDMVSAARKLTSQEIYITVALTSDALRNRETIDAIVRLIDRTKIKGVYMVCEHPHGHYLTDDTLWLLNFLQAVSAVRLSGKDVFVGYASHQQLSLVLAKCNTIFSGNYLNMRHFATTNFELGEDNGPSRHARWYYAPALLSEFRTVTLDVAYQRDLLEALKSPFKESRHAELLFSGEMPSGTAYKDADSFMHYLDSLYRQCTFFTRPTYQETFEVYLSTLQTAARSVEGLRKEGIYDGTRSYLNCIDATESAIFAFDKEMGYLIREMWTDLDN